MIYWIIIAIITVTFSFTPVSSAMDVVYAFTKDTSITSVNFLTNDTVVITSNKGCVLYSIGDNSTQTISNNYVYNAAHSPNGKNIALVEEKQIVIYTIEKNKVKESWVISNNDRVMRVNQIAFVNNEILVELRNDIQNRVLHHHNSKFKTSSASTSKWLNNYLFITPMPSFPQRSEVCFIHDQFHLVRAQIKDGSMSMIKSINCNKAPRSATYNFDGSIIVVNESNEKYTFFSIENNSSYSFKNKNKKSIYVSVAFHNNNHLAALLLENGTIEYLKYKESKLESIVHLPGYNLAYQSYDQKKLLAFSPDGRLIVAASKLNIYLGNTMINGPYSTKCYFLITAVLNTMELPKDIVNSIQMILIDILAWMGNLSSSGEEIPSKQLSQTALKTETEKALICLEASLKNPQIFNYNTLTENTLKDVKFVDQSVKLITDDSIKQTLTNRVSIVKKQFKLLAIATLNKAFDEQNVNRTAKDKKDREKLITTISKIIAASGYDDKSLALLKKIPLKIVTALEEYIKIVGKNNQETSLDHYCYILDLINQVNSYKKAFPWTISDEVNVEIKNIKMKLNQYKESAKKIAYQAYQSFVNKKSKSKKEFEAVTGIIEIAIETGLLDNTQGKNYENLYNNCANDVNDQELTKKNFLKYLDMRTKTPDKNVSTTSARGFTPWIGWLISSILSPLSWFIALFLG